jgi:phenylalanyl-tRNA synthetase beta chain
MKLPVAWLMDYLPAELHGAGFGAALEAACKRWNVKPASDVAQTLGRLMTFAGFNCDEVVGSGVNAVLVLDVLSNRPDAQCVLGLAREVAVILQGGLKSPAYELTGMEAGEPASQVAEVTVEDPELCPRYTARVIRGVKVGPSPQWLKERLAWIGLQSHNNIVDVTNFICFELNQPLHAFDLNSLEGRQIVVRRARDKEAFTPLYGEIPPLTTETLVIADAKNARAIAGVLGGKGSEVTPGTTDILLEAAYFNPANTRRTVRRLKVMDGRGTDSSYRFERGIDVEAVDRASARAARLIVEVAGGKIAPGIIDVWAQKRPAKTLELRFAELNRVFGAAVPKDVATKTLVALGGTISSEAPDRVAVTVPSWRRGDLEREIDLIEEVARIYGFNHVPDITAMSARVPERSAQERTSEKLRTLFTSLGYFECVSDSLIDPKWPNIPAWTAQKPIRLDKASVLREDHSALRNSLTASLLSVRQLNQDRRTGEARLFEIGKVFLPSSSGKPDARPDERPIVALLDDRGFQPLFDALQRLGDALDLDAAHLKFSPPLKGVPDGFRADLSRQILRVRELPGDERAENAIGWIGVITPELQKGFELRKPVAMAEIDLHALANLPTAPKRYKPLPQYPEIVRDVALVVGEAVSWAEIESFARNWAAQDKLRDASEQPRFLSVFRGKQVGDGKKSLALSVLYRAADRTLTDDEVNAAHDKFKQAMAAHFKATLRE